MIYRACKYTHPDGHHFILTLPHEADLPTVHLIACAVKRVTDAGEVLTESDLHRFEVIDHDTGIERPIGMHVSTPLPQKQRRLYDLVRKTLAFWK